MKLKEYLKSNKITRQEFADIITREGKPTHRQTVDRWCNSGYEWLDGSVVMRCTTQTPKRPPNGQ